MDHRERARKFNVEYQHVDAMIVLTRDDFTCYLCGRRADEHAYISRAWDNYVPNPLYPTLDHIIPLSRGGSHSYDNTACACWECNLAKGSMTPDEFYAVRLEAAS
jgi:5-methylcytosine-specific restriction endonuclease McrA